MGHLLSTRPPPICGGRALGPTKLCTRDTAGGQGVEGEGVEGEGVVGEGVEGEGVVGEGVVVGEGDGGDSGAGDKSSGAPAGPPTTQDF